MIRVSGKWDDLSQFYNFARGKQEKAHGDGYCNHHDAVVRLLPKGGTYLELGLHQGVSAAGAILNSKLKKAVLVDNDMKLYKPHKPLFEKYCSDNNITLDVRHIDSTNVKSSESCDVLLIDSLHTAPHLEKELKTHARNVRVGIVFHDTSHKPELWDVIQEFLNNNEEWVLKERFEESVGYTVIVRR